MFILYIWMILLSVRGEPFPVFFFFASFCAMYRLLQIHGRLHVMKSGGGESGLRILSLRTCTGLAFEDIGDLSLILGNGTAHFLMIADFTFQGGMALNASCHYAHSNIYNRPFRTTLPIRRNAMSTSSQIFQPTSPPSHFQINILITAFST